MNTFQTFIMENRNYNSDGIIYVDARAYIGVGIGCVQGTDDVNE